MYRPREANIIADHLAGIASRAAYELPIEQSQPIEIPYHIQSGAIVLDERPGTQYITKNSQQACYKFDNVL